MCGLVGVISPKIPNIGLINSASESLYHRGPDAEGIYTHTFKGLSVTLVHRRVSIIDLNSRSNQPFKFKNYVLTFNGEIYNYKELKEELRGKGFDFETDGDTEVLATALFYWGIKAIDKLEGMWAFAWYNELNGELILCRDRFGEKPLYYWQIEDSIYFGSEIKALRALSGKNPIINKNHLKRYLINGFRSLYKTEETFYENIYEIPVSSILKFSSNIEFEQSKYWLPNKVKVQNFSRKEAIKQTKESLINAVNLSLRSDVPIAFCMSGGVDSNTLISIAKRELGCDVHGFTISNTDKRYDEEELIKKSVKELNIKHTFLKPSESNFIENIKKLISIHDKPICTISYYVHWLLMECINREGFKVSISGTGADELFTGYYDHYNYFLKEIEKKDELYKKSFKDWEKFQKPIVRNPYLKDIKSFLKDSSNRDYLYLNNNIFKSFLVDKWGEDFIETYYVQSPLRNRMLNELFVESVKVILDADDLNSMSYSIENRSPFLNKNLFNTAYSIPTEHLIKNGYKKSILRDAMKGIVPDIILNNREKIGFNAPIIDLIDTKDQQTRAYLLDDSPIYEIVRKEKIIDLLNEKYLENSYSKFLFNFICAKIFIEMNHH